MKFKIVWIFLIHFFGKQTKNSSCCTLYNTVNIFLPPTICEKLFHNSASNPTILIYTTPISQSGNKTWIL